MGKNGNGKIMTSDKEDLCSWGWPRSGLLTMPPISGLGGCTSLKENLGVH